MTASSLVFSAMSILIPCARGVSTYIVASTRFITGGLAILGMGLLGLIRLRPVNWRWLAVRGIFGALGVYLYYLGIVNLGLGMGTVLNYTYPVFAALLAPLILKEKIAVDVIVAVLISFIGIYLVVNPAGVETLFRRGVSGATPAALFASLSVNGLLALLGGVAASVAVVAIKKLRETDTSPVIYLAQCAFGALVIGYPTATSSFFFPPVMWLLLLSIGVLATVAQLLMTSAYKWVSATEGSLLTFLVPVLNVMFGVALFGERMRTAAVIGSVVVIAACLYVALRERIVRLAG
jgi:drug/metabolite transporter (DMT)-like permease